MSNAFFLTDECHEIYNIYKELDEKIFEDDECGIPETEPGLFILKYKLYILLYSHPKTRNEIFQASLLDLNKQDDDLIKDLLWAYTCFDNQKSSNKIIRVVDDVEIEIKVTQKNDCNNTRYEFWSFYYSRIKRLKREKFDELIGDILSLYLENQSATEPNLKEVLIDFDMLNNLSALLNQIVFFSCSSPYCTNLNCHNRIKENKNLQEIVNSIV